MENNKEIPSIVKKFQNMKFNKKSYKNFAGDNLATMPAGFCCYPKHIGYITSDTIKSHNCLGKKCEYLIKNNKHDFWKEHNKKNVNKKYFQMIEKRYLDKEITRERYNELKSVISNSYKEDYILTHDKKIQEKTLEGKLTVYVEKNGNVERITQEQLSEKYFGKNDKKAREFWITLATSLNEENEVKINKYNTTKRRKYREAIYKILDVGKRKFIYGKSMNEEYAKKIDIKWKEKE